MKDLSNKKFVIFNSKSSLGLYMSNILIFFKQIHQKVVRAYWVNKNVIGFSHLNSHKIILQKGIVWFVLNCSRDNRLFII
jgi:hypothetical protein